MSRYFMSSIPPGAIAIFLALIFGLGWGAVAGVQQLLAPPTAFEMYHEAGLRNLPLAAAPPRQSNGSREDIPFKPGIDLIQRADFEVTALVLAAQRYRVDENAVIAPVDLALGWGAMSVPEIVESFRITQSRRFYFWSTDSLPIAHREVVESSANMHMIPVDEAVRAQLLTVRSGDVVTIRGHLVDVRTEKGIGWRSSLTRSDTGAGACEVILVASLEIIRSPDIPGKSFP